MDTEERDEGGWPRGVGFEVPPDDPVQRAGFGPATRATVAKERKVDMRTAAFVLAITRVGKAATSRYHSVRGVKF